MEENCLSVKPLTQAEGLVSLGHGFNTSESGNLSTVLRGSRWLPWLPLPLDKDAKGVCTAATLAAYLGLAWQLSCIAAASWVGAGSLLH